MSRYIVEFAAGKEPAELIKLFSIDSVFGVYTRQAFQYIFFPQIKNRISSIIFADIDNLHHLNNEFGYKHVDALIKKAIATRGEDIVMRWYSGDEIVWVLLDGDHDAVAKRIVARLKSVNITATISSKKTGPIANWHKFMSVIEELCGEVTVKKLANNITSRHETV